ncbi:hypothetical protein R69608_07195 [Paraburkholderia nemoris]|nr:hypothetical protein R69608_07195 [Paraburkholderia nemoris]
MKSSPGGPENGMTSYGSRRIGIYAPPAVGSVGWIIPDSRSHRHRKIRRRDVT